MPRNKTAVNARANGEFDLWFGIVANAFMWAAFWMVIFMGFSSSNMSASSGHAFAIVNAAGQCVGIVFAGCYFKRLANLESLPLTIMLAIVSTTLYFVIFRGLPALAPLPRSASWVLYGLISAFLWVDMAAYLARRSIGEIALSLSASSLLGALLVIFEMLLLPNAATVFSALFIPISLLLFCMSHRCQSAQARTYHRAIIARQPSTWAAIRGVGVYSKFFLMIVVFGLTFGFHIGATFSEIAVSSILIDIALLLPGLALVVTFYVFKRTINFRTLSAVILLLTIAAMLPWLHEGEAASPLSALVVWAAFTLFDLSAVATLMEIGKNGTVACFISILFGRLVVMLTVTMGMAIVLLTGIGKAVGAYESVVTSILVLVLVAAFAWFATGRHMLEARAPLPEQGPFKMAIIAIAEEYGLSRRECEILPFVAKGYNAEHIGTDLYVSSNTIKSHLYHIYAKLDVHTQQEVIRLVDTKVEKYRTIL